MPGLDPSSRLFGSSQRTAVLLAIRLLKDTYATELASLLGLSLFSVQKILKAFEAEGVVVTRSLGRTRQVSLNPRFVSHRELEALLWNLAKQDVELQKKLAQKRRRPRRTSKAF